jgi:hypothetical protein
MAATAEGSSTATSSGGTATQGNGTRWLPLLQQVHGGDRPRVHRLPLWWQAGSLTLVGGLRA